MANLGSLIFNIGADTSRLKSAQREVSSSLDAMNSQANTLLRTLGIMGAGAGMVALGKHALNTASSFERMTVALDVMTKGKGQRTFDALNEAAMRLPGNTESIIQTFVRLKAVGMDVTIKDLTTLVDTAAVGFQGFVPTIEGVSRALGQMSATGKVIMQDVHQLEAWGINAFELMGKALGKSAEEMREIVKEGMNSKVAVRALLTGMEQTYGGMSDRLTKTWSGMTEIITSYWVEFERRLMSSGPFDVMKTNLAEFVNFLDKAKEDGRLDIWAKDMAQGVISAFAAMTIAAQGFINSLRAVQLVYLAVKSTVREQAGSWRQSLLEWGTGVIKGSNLSDTDKAAELKKITGIMAYNVEDIAEQDRLKQEMNDLVSQIEGSSKTFEDARSKLAEVWAQIELSRQKEAEREPSAIKSEQETLEQVMAKYGLSAPGGKGRKGAGPMDLRKINQDLSQIMSAAADAGRALQDLQYEYAILQKTGAGQFGSAEWLRTEKGILDQTAEAWKGIESAQEKYRETQEKLAGAKGGGTQEAFLELAAAKKYLDEAWFKGLQKISLIPEEAFERFRQYNEQMRLAGQVELAQVNVQYAEMRGNMQEVYQAQLALINASEAEKMANLNKDIPGLVEAYRKLYDEQRRMADLQANGSFWDGMSEGLRQVRNETSSFKNGMDFARKGIDDLSGTMADMAMGIKTDFSSMARSVIRDLIQIQIKMAALSLFGVSSKAMSGGLWGFLSSLIGLGGSSTSGGYGGVVMPDRYYSGMAGGGTITEPVIGVGRSGHMYAFGEGGQAEDVVPRRGRSGGSSMTRIEFFVDPNLRMRVDEGPTREEFDATVKSIYLRAMTTDENFRTMASSFGNRS